jgi:hypothetical protein
MWTAAEKAAMPGRWHNRYRLVVVPIAGPRSGQLELWLYLDNQAITIPEALDVLQLVDGSDVAVARARTDEALGLEAAAILPPEPLDSSVPSVIPAWPVQR